MRPRSSGRSSTTLARPGGGVSGGAAVGQQVVDQDHARPRRCASAPRRCGGRGSPVRRSTSICRAAASRTMALGEAMATVRPGEAGRRRRRRRRSRTAPRTRSPRPRPSTPPTPRRPPIASASRVAIARPSPAPIWRASRPEPPCENASKICARSASGTPGPVSDTVKRSTPSASRSARTSTPPVSTNFTALPARLSRICREPPLVGDDRGEAGVRRPADLDALLVRPGTEQLADLAQQVLRRHRRARISSTRPAPSRA